jgi:broad specificity phosphatase PhoE/GNAT superfamily N-acetyltransferase
MSNFYDLQLKRPQQQKLSHPILGTVTQIVVTPQSEDWPLYLDTYINYLIESWPHDFERQNIVEIRNQEEITLHERYLTSRRLFLLWKQNSSEVLGFANVFLDGENEKEKLNVAEFGVNEKNRKRGIGRWLIGFVKDYARFNGVLSWVVEVDLNSQANLFWSKIENLNLVKSFPRNIYEGKIDPLRIVWLRHGKSKECLDLDRCPFENEISITNEAIDKAHKMGEDFNEPFPREIYVSNYKRTMETAIAFKGNSPWIMLQASTKLREFFPEVLMGKSFTEIRDKYVTNLKQKLFTKPSELFFENSETLIMAQARISEKVEEIRRIWSTTGDRIIISHEVAHALFICSILGSDINSVYAIRLSNLNCSLFLWNELRHNFDIEFLNRPFQKNLE